MREMFYTAVEFQTGVGEAAEKMQVIIDNLRLVEDNVSSLGSDLERWVSTIQKHEYSLIHCVTFQVRVERRGVFAAEMDRRYMHQRYKTSTSCC